MDQAQLQTFLNQQSSGRSSQANTVKSDGRTTVYGQQFGSNNDANSQGSKNYQVRRATDSDVQSFLNMQNKTGSQGSENSTAANGERSLLKGGGQNFARNRDDGNSNAGNSNANGGDRISKDGKQFKFNNGSNNELNNQVNKNREWATARNGERGDQLEKHLNSDKSKGPKLGDGRNFGIDKGFVRDGGDREFRGSDRARGDFKNWSNIWSGKGGEGHDHRDWSGKWRDGDRFNIAHDIRGDWNNRRDHDRFPFRNGWWGHDHHGWGFWNDYCVRWNRPWFWWSWSSAPVLYDWCGFGWSTPYYWDYGPGEYIYCNDGVVYVNGVWYQPAPVFYQQTVQMVETAPVLAQQAAAQVDWLPLGVFAATPDGLKEPSVMVQLAVTKEGIIGGTAFDQKAGKSYNIQGTVDKNTQRAVWSYNDDKNNRILMETSVNNLTQNESTGLVHYGPNDMRVVEFVRLQEPDAKPAADQPAAPMLPPQGK